MSLGRQFSAFFLVGLAATAAHYAVLIALVEGAGAPAPPAALAGAMVGAVVSYLLNRRHVFDTQRTHVEAGWRFAVVSGVGFALTYGAMRLLVDRFGAPYLPAQVLTTGVVMAWNFLAHKYWSFRDPR